MKIQNVDGVARSALLPDGRLVWLVHGKKDGKEYYASCSSQAQAQYCLLACDKKVGVV